MPENAIFVTPLLQASGRQASQLVQTGVGPLGSIELHCFKAREVFVLHLPKLLPDGSSLPLASSVVRNMSMLINQCYPGNGSSVKINVVVHSCNPCTLWSLTRGRECVFQFLNKRPSVINSNAASEPFTSLMNPDLEMAVFIKAWM